MRYVVHGLSTLSWAGHLDTEETDWKTVWNLAASLPEDTPTQVIDQTKRILAVHPEHQRCQFCPPKTHIQKPQPENPKESK